MGVLLGAWESLPRLQGASARLQACSWVQDCVGHLQTEGGSLACETKQTAQFPGPALLAPFVPSPLPLLAAGLSLVTYRTLALHAGPGLLFLRKRSSMAQCMASTGFWCGSGKEGGGQAQGHGRGQGINTLHIDHVLLLLLLLPTAGRDREERQQLLTRPILSQHFSLSQPCLTPGTRTLACAQACPFTTWGTRWAAMQLITQKCAVVSGNCCSLSQWGRYLADMQRVRHAQSYPHSASFLHSKSQCDRSQVLPKFTNAAEL